MFDNDEMNLCMCVVMVTQGVKEFSNSTNIKKVIKTIKRLKRMYALFTNNSSVMLSSNLNLILCGNKFTH